MPSCANYVLHTHDVIDDVTRSISRSNLKIPIHVTVFIVERGNKNYHNLWLTGPPSNTPKFRFDFALKDRQRSKIGSVWGNFQNRWLVHDSFNFTSDMRSKWQIV